MFLEIPWRASNQEAAPLENLHRDPPDSWHTLLGCSYPCGPFVARDITLALPRGKSQLSSHGHFVVGNCDSHWTLSLALSISSLFLSLTLSLSQRFHDSQGSRSKDSRVGRFEGFPLSRPLRNKTHLAPMPRFLHRESWWCCIRCIAALRGIQYYTPLTASGSLKGQVCQKPLFLCLCFQNMKAWEQLIWLRLTRPLRLPDCIASRAHCRYDII